MTHITLTKQEEYNEIINSLKKGTGCASLSDLPEIWTAIANGTIETGLSDESKAHYIEAAQLYKVYDTPKAMEALAIIGEDFKAEKYPDLDKFSDEAETLLEVKTAAALNDLYQEFGRAFPASFYEVFIALVQRPDAHVSIDIFKDKNYLQRDCLWDSILHAILLVNPVSLRVQSVFSKHGLRFQHLKGCTCKVSITAEAPFEVALDPELKTAYLQNVVAAAIEQYDYNAFTASDDYGKWFQQ